MPATPRVTPRTKRPTHDITLTDGIRTYGLRVDPTDLKEVPQTPSTLHLTAGGGSASKYGDFDPTMAQLVQNDWSGGRGQENFSDDPSRYFDGQSVWSMTPNKLLPGGMWFPPSVGMRTASVNLPGHQTTKMNMNWVGLIGANRFHATPVAVGGGGFTTDKCYMWIRRVGSPGTLTFELRTDSGGAPSNTALQTVTKTVSNITDFVAVFQVFDWSGTQALVAGTYQLVISGASTDNAANHWDIGMDSTAASGTVSTSGTGSWTVTTSPYFWLVDTDTTRKWTFFELDGGLYAVDARKDGTSSDPLSLFLNGYRGTATAATSSTLTDTRQAFNVTDSVLTTQETVKILYGTGAGQVRRISSYASATQMNVTPNWDITPDTTSQYVVLGSVYWQAITGHGLTKPVTSVISVDKNGGTAFFAQGSSTNVRKMRFNGTTHQFAGENFQADLLYTAFNPSTKEVVIAVLKNVPCTYQATLKFNSFSDSLDFTGTTVVKVGNPAYSITGVCDYNGKLYIAKEDSLWTIEGTYAQKMNVGLGSSPHINNGKALVVNGLFLYFSYMHSVEKLYGTTLDDVGPWRGSGIPAGRTGVISSMVSAFSWVFAAVDAGVNGTSSVLCYDGTGWHEIFRAWEVGKRIESIYWQSVPDAFPRLWISVGGDVTFVQFPLNTLTPTNDSGFQYQHEAVLTTSTIDFGNARLPKFFKELAAIQKNLAQGIYIAVDYQLDANIGGTTWTYLGSFLQSPEDTLPQNFGNARQIRLRLRLITNVATTPVELRALIQEGYSRTPVKYQYNIRVREKPNQVNRRGGKDVDPDVLYNWLREKANGASRIRIRSRYKSIDNRDVIVEPPVLNRTSADSTKGSWGGELLITVRDA